MIMAEVSGKKEASGDTAKQSPIKIPHNRPRLSHDGDSSYVTPTASPSSEHRFLVPSPMVTRRTRTYSASRRATEGPMHHGECTFFSRSRGHGFIQPTDGSSEEPIFMHVSDIESEYVPMPGDRITFKLTRIPPKNEKFQAVEVRIVGLCLDEKNAHHHVRWDGSPSGI
ncbi:calcium-regulated heat-stable protein 1-like [Clavelina lepadiformis]|uniref:calcium-regulated heat-stable protein 1-like n=1 Tax=Clavelina lepadiformis TaxID=159417 RepID=UPI004042B722